MDGFNGGIWFEVKSEEVVAHYRELQRRAADTAEAGANAAGTGTALDAMERAAKQQYLAGESKRLGFLAEHVPANTVFRLDQYNAARFAEGDEVSQMNMPSAPPSMGRVRY